MTSQQFICTYFSNAHLENVGIVAYLTAGEGEEAAVGDKYRVKYLKGWLTDDVGTNPEIWDTVVKNKNLHEIFVLNQALNSIAFITELANVETSIPSAQPTYVFNPNSNTNVGGKNYTKEELLHNVKLSMKGGPIGAIDNDVQDGPYFTDLKSMQAATIANLSKFGITSIQYGENTPISLESLQEESDAIFLDEVDTVNQALVEPDKPKTNFIDVEARDW